MAASIQPAEPTRTPPPSPRQTQAAVASGKHRLQVEGRERRSMVRGLIVLALLVLLISIVRAGLDRVFPNGWWKP